MTTTAGIKLDASETFGALQFNGVDVVKFDASGVTSGVLRLGAPAATTSGTEVTITGIPAWAKKVTLMLDGVSLIATDNLLIQLGDSGGVETSGYVFAEGRVATGNSAEILASTTGFVSYLGGPSRAATGTFTLTLMDDSTNKWVCQSSIYNPVLVNMGFGSGIKSLSTPLDRVRITSVSGSVALDAGSINILYE